MRNGPNDLKTGHLSLDRAARLRPIESSRIAEVVRFARTLMAKRSLLRSIATQSALLTQHNAALLRADGVHDHRKGTGTASYTTHFMNRSSRPQDSNDESNRGGIIRRRRDAAGRSLKLNHGTINASAIPARRSALSGMSGRRSSRSFSSRRMAISKLLIEGPQFRETYLRGYRNSSFG